MLSRSSGKMRVLGANSIPYHVLGALIIWILLASGLTNLILRGTSTRTSKVPNDPQFKWRI
jgi:hypothetical protein